MTYSLEFDRRALKEWNKLGDTLRQQFKKKLSEVLENPRIEANRLRQLPDCYKLKLQRRLPPDLSGSGSRSRSFRSCDRKARAGSCLSRRAGPN